MPGEGAAPADGGAARATTGVYARSSVRVPPAAERTCFLAFDTISFIGLTGTIPLMVREATGTGRS